MQTHLLVGPIPIKGCRRFSSSISGDILPPSSNPISRDIRRRHRNRSKSTVTSAAYSSSSSSSASNHYVVLGVARNATQVDIKRAYRLLARKFHPDVNKDSRAGELFKSIRCSYQVLSNEATRTQYDRALKLQENSRFHRVKRHYYSTDVEDDINYYYSWSEKRHRSTTYERFYGQYSTYPNSDFYSETESEPQEEEEQRDSFVEVLKSAFLSMFLLYTLECLASLTFSTFTALLDKELDMGYKVGFMIAWILGGKGGILLTLCLTFASSSVVVLVVVAMWVGSNLARHASLPQGALLTLLYMSIKLQVDST